MGISIWQLVIVLTIAPVLFGVKRPGRLGVDFGAVARSFRHVVRDDGQTPAPPATLVDRAGTDRV